MKKWMTFCILFSLITGCFQTDRRNWIIPLVNDPADTEYTSAHSPGYEKRRQIAADSMNGGIMVLKSTDQWSYNRHGFRPNNYFYYLTGLELPGAYLFLGGLNDSSLVLSVPSQDRRNMVYHGTALPAGELMKKYGATRILDHNKARQHLDSLLASGTELYVDKGNTSLVRDLKMMAGPGIVQDVRDVAPLLDELRVTKDFIELDRLQKACNITSQALVNAMVACKPGKYEYEVEAVIEGTFLEYGSAMPGFPSIVGSGPNSTILHYDRNRRKMEPGDLLLMDVGADYGMYSADVTRTIPVNGKFTPEQRAIYELVLEAQHAAIERMKPGNGFIDGHLAARDVLVRGLHGLGLLTDPLSPWQVRFYLLHGSSHYLGMDVHDVGDMGGTFAGFMALTHLDSIPSRTLEPGMVLTIEPGLYFRETALQELQDMAGDVADPAEITEFVNKVGPEFERYVNIGVRIEDDILITPSGNLCLSRYAPKAVEDIEQIMH